MESFIREKKNFEFNTKFDGKLNVTFELTCSLR